MEVSKICEVVEENSVQKSVVQFVNGNSGEVTEEVIPVISWAKIVNKEVVSPPGSTIGSVSKKGNNPSSSITNDTINKEMVNPAVSVIA